MTDNSAQNQPSTLDDVVARPVAHVRIRNLSGTIVLAVGQDVVELSDIAETIWRALAPGRTVRGVTHVVASTYGEPEPTVADDVRDFLTDLQRRGFVGFHRVAGNDGDAPCP